MSEFAPPPPKVRVTKKQLRQVQENYERAQVLAENLSEKEIGEKQQEIQSLEKKLEDIF
jgi:hypothetical protein